jgi:hypothetical protein
MDQPRPTSPTSPPRARLAFRVGVVGHRPNRLAEADFDKLGRLIRKVLNTVQWTVRDFASRTDTGGTLYSAEPFLLRAITALAEGTDRLFADQALDAGYALCCPMPFHQAEYERDFVEPEALEPNSLDRFRGLLHRASENADFTIFEMDGDPAHRGEAYGAAGRIVLNQSDLLIVVWDGAKAAGAGGTVDTLREAIRYRVPVLWIDAVQPHPWRLLSPGDDLKCLESDQRCTPGLGPGNLAQAVKKLVIDEIALPTQADDDPVTLEQYFSERKPRFHRAMLWKLFRDLVGSGETRRQPLRVAAFEEALQDWPVGAAAQPATVAEWVNRRLRPHYAWADKLADAYGDAYRSTYIFIYLSAAIAVFLALLPSAAGWTHEHPGGNHEGQAVCIAVEFVIVSMISVLLAWEKKGSWHKRWIAYRLLAEVIRQLRCLVPLGGGRPLTRVPGHLAVYGDPARTWMYWHLRAIARATAIPTAVVRPDYVTQVLSYLDLVIRGPSSGQLHFHLTNKRRSEHISHRLHEASVRLFRMTIVCILWHLSPHLPLKIHLDPTVEGWLTLACATLPAFGAAMAGINNQGEFARIAKRSASMADAFRGFAARLDVLKERAKAAGSPLRISEITPLATETAQLMVDEVVEWRVVFIDRPATEA